MKRFTLLTFILAVMLGFTSCGPENNSNPGQTSASFYSNPYSGTDALNINQITDIDQKYNVIKQAMQNKSITEGLEQFDFFEHEEANFSTSFFQFVTFSRRKKAVDSVGSTTVNYTEFTGQPVINPSSASAKVYTSTQKNEIIDLVFSRSHVKILQSITVVTVNINGRNYPGYQLNYIEQDPISNFFYQNRVSQYVVCLETPFMANPILVNETVAGGKYVKLRAADFNQNN